MIRSKGKKPFQILLTGLMLVVVGMSAVACGPTHHHKRPPHVVVHA